MAKDAEVYVDYAHVVDRMAAIAVEEGDEPGNVLVATLKAGGEYARVLRAHAKGARTEFEQDMMLVSIIAAIRERMDYHN